MPDALLPYVMHYFCYLILYISRTWSFRLWSSFPSLNPVPSYLILLFMCFALHLPTWSFVFLLNVSLLSLLFLPEPVYLPDSVFPSLILCLFLLNPSRSYLILCFPVLDPFPSRLILRVLSSQLQVLSMRHESRFASWGSLVATSVPRREGVAMLLSRPLPLPADRSPNALSLINAQCSFFKLRNPPESMYMYSETLLFLSMMAVVVVVVVGFQ